jgi:branched-chain amino acid transport system permease protein
MSEQLTPVNSSTLAQPSFLERLFPERVRWSQPQVLVSAVVLLLLIALPIIALATKQPFYITLFTRIMIYAVAACALNLLIGYTGLVSFGQSLFLALGAYAVGIPSFHALTNGWVHLIFALLGSATVAALIGVVVLRTQGMAFIMITLAFAQMFFYLGISLKNYGGDDGIRLEARSTLFPFDLSTNTALYYFCLLLLIAVLFFSWRLIHSGFGMTLRGIKGNERRMKAMGFDTLKFKLAIYIIAAMITSVAGFLLANLTSYTSPAFSAWTVSGEIIVMVVLGGMGTIFGPVIGAIGFLMLEEGLKELTEFWGMPLGIIIVAIVLLAKRGIYGSLKKS